MTKRIYPPEFLPMPRMCETANEAWHWGCLTGYRTKLSEQDDPAPAAEDDAEFRRGVKAFFDYLLMRSANHWHGKPEINEKCLQESKLIESWALDALEEIEPEDASEWRNLTAALLQLSQANATISRLQGKK